MFRTAAAKLTVELKRAGGDVEVAGMLAEVLAQLRSEQQDAA